MKRNFFLSMQSALLFMALFLALSCNNGKQQENINEESTQAAAYDTASLKKDSAAVNPVPVLTAGDSVAAALAVLQNDAAKHSTPLIMASEIPADVISLIKNTPKTQDVFSIGQDGYEFKNKILKCDVLTFQNSGTLIMSAVDADWIAIVAKTIKFVAPREEAYITIPTDRISVGHGSTVSDYSTAAAAGNKGDPGGNGSPGKTGLNGANGGNGLNGKRVPVLYIFTEQILNQPGAVLPTNLALTIKNNGVNGGYGGNGQNGQDGGYGGNGGPAKVGFLGNCDAGAGSGGNGGNGGIGGKSGNGGNGGNGGDIYYCGTIKAINLLEFSDVKNKEGIGGIDGTNGNNGNGGAAGVRGEHRGSCQGGGSGESGRIFPDDVNIPGKGRDGMKGKIQRVPFDVSLLF